MKPIPPPDSMYLEAAKGWYELHAFTEALEELQHIAPAFHAHPLVLEVKWWIYAKLKKWDEALQIATLLLKIEPDWALAWIYKASSSSALGQREAAYQILLEALVKFPSEKSIPSFLACTCCALERFEEAIGWLERVSGAGPMVTLLTCLCSFIPSDTLAKQLKDPTFAVAVKESVIKHLKAQISPGSGFSDSDQK